MNILITGGTGLIGLLFIDKFRDYKCTVLTRFPGKAKSQLPESVELISSLDELHDLNAFDSVINLAGEPIIDKRWSEKQKDIISQSRWQTTQRLVDLFARSKKPPKVFLSGSAIGVYGHRGDEILTETSTVKKNNFPTTLCMHWEELAKQAEPHTRVVIMRTGIVLAPQGGALRKMLLPFKCYLGGKIGTGQQFMSWIHYQDYVNAMNYLLTTDGLSGAVNLAAPEPAINKEFTQVLAKTLHRIAIVPVPKKVLERLLGESSCLLLDSQRVFPKALLDSGFKFCFPNLKVALQEMLASTSQDRMN